MAAGIVVRMEFCYSSYVRGDYCAGFKCIYKALRKVCRGVFAEHLERFKGLRLPGGAGGIIVFIRRQSGKTCNAAIPQIAAIVIIKSLHFGQVSVNSCGDRIPVVDTFYRFDRRIEYAYQCDA